jgi:hypothetical protein
MFTKLIALSALIGTATATHKWASCAKKFQGHGGCDTCRAVGVAADQCKDSSGKYGTMNWCAAVKDGKSTECEAIEKAGFNFEETFKKFSFVKCNMERNKKAMAPENMDKIWNAYEDHHDEFPSADGHGNNDLIHFNCAMAGCCKHFPEGYFEPFPHTGKACKSDANPEVIECFEDGCPDGYRGDPDENWFGGTCGGEDWEWHKDEERFKSTTATLLRSN